MTTTMLHENTHDGIRIISNNSKNAFITTNKEKVNLT